jgi:hypothetical protein
MSEIKVVPCPQCGTTNPYKRECALERRVDLPKDAATKFKVLDDVIRRVPGKGQYGVITKVYQTDTAPELYCVLWDNGNVRPESGISASALKLKNPHDNSPEAEQKYRSLIGKKVEKVSGKPFKSTYKLNTVKDVFKHPETGYLCFTFEQDESYVECFRCIAVKGHQ